MWRDKQMVLFMDQTGPLLAYRHGFLDVQDLNPENEMRWRMSRWEIFKLGLSCLTAAMLAR
jgi:hypothetical protein